MLELGKSNQAIASACGVSEKIVRQWRGQCRLPNEEPKPIPSDMVIRFPRDLKDRWLKLLDALWHAEVLAERKIAVLRASGNSR